MIITYLKYSKLIMKMITKGVLNQSRVVQYDNNSIKTMALPDLFSVW